MKRIIISRTDAIGDVILTLPMAGILKQQIPELQIIFFGKTYTEAVVRCSEHIDEFVNFDDFIKLDENERITFIKNINADVILHVFPRKEIAYAAKHANINTRIGTSHRLYHLITCNKRISFTRKNSDLHEAQLNLKLLAGLNIDTAFSLEEIAAHYGFIKIPVVADYYRRITDTKRLNVVIHPRSHGSAREWGLENYRELIFILIEHSINVFISGSDKEKLELDKWLESIPPQVHNMMGRLNLSELIGFLSITDGIVAGSTGPLHIAAAEGLHALGIFPPIRPMHAGRWAPVGRQAEFITFPKNCSDCRLKPANCSCLKNITPQQVADVILRWKK